MCFYYGYLNFILGMKLPKYNLCYNTRDLIKSLAENTNDQNKTNTDYANYSLHILIFLQILKKYLNRNLRSVTQTTYHSCQVVWNTG